MGFKKVLERIEKINEEIKKSTNELIGLSLEKNPETRIMAIEALQYLKTDEVEDRVFSGLNDKNELVRVTCLETIEYWGLGLYSERILNALDDKSDLVRGKAAIALATIKERRVINILKDRLNNVNDEERQRYLYSLCRLGENEFFNSFLNGLFNDFYRIRCSTANLVLGLVNEENRSFVLNILKAVEKNEKTEAALSSIKSTILMLEGKDDENKKKDNEG
jgi:HEAT repeat protein